MLNIIENMPNMIEQMNRIHVQGAATRRRCSYAAQARIIKKMLKSIKKMLNII